MSGAAGTSATAEFKFKVPGVAYLAPGVAYRRNGCVGGDGDAVKFQGRLVELDAPPHQRLA